MTKKEFIKNFLMYSLALSPVWGGALLLVIIVIFFPEVIFSGDPALDEPLNEPFLLIPEQFLILIILISIVIIAIWMLIKYLYHRKENRETDVSRSSNNDTKPTKMRF